MEQRPPRHLLLIGEYELSIDDKNRLLIPSDIRRMIDPERDGKAFYLVLGYNRRPWLYPERYYEDMVFQEQPEITPGEEQLAFDHVNFALASKIEWDTQGRLLIPEKTLRRTELKKEVTLIGARDHLEIWNRADWESWREELVKRSPEIAIRAKKARQTPGSDKPG